MQLPSAPAVASPADRRFYVFTAALSAAVLGFLAWLLVFRTVDPVAGADLRFMPAVNACLNSVSTVLLVSGWVAIRRGNRRLHPYLMVGAVACSVLFLIGYVAYHYVHGDTKFAGTGAVRTVYLAILASHVLLSMLVPPLVGVTLWFAARRRFPRHRRLARWLLPIWLYVSVTGVIIFFMLRGSLPAAG